MIPLSSPFLLLLLLLRFLIDVTGSRTPPLLVRALELESRKPRTNPLVFLLSIPLLPPLSLHTFPLRPFSPTACPGNSSPPPLFEKRIHATMHELDTCCTIDPTRWNLDATGCIATPRRPGTTVHALRCVRASVANLVESLVTFDHVLGAGGGCKRPSRPYRGIYDTAQRYVSQRVHRDILISSSLAFLCSSLDYELSWFYLSVCNAHSHVARAVVLSI